MVTDQQVRRLMMLINKEKTQAIVVGRAGMEGKIVVMRIFKNPHVRKNKYKSKKVKSRPHTQTFL